MSFVEKTTLPYLVKSVYKVLLFGGVPLLYLLLTKQQPAFLKLSLIRKDFVRLLLWGGGTYVAILFAYFLLKGSLILPPSKPNCPKT
jgi:hypothetical protein